MEVKFRIAMEEDVDDIIRLCNECFDEPLDFNYARSVFEKYKDDENQIYLVGIVDEKIVSHVKISIITTMYKEMNNFSILNHVCVKPEYRRNNIATRMLYECERISSEHDCKLMQLWSNNSRIPAHACYKAYGFKPVDCQFFRKVVDFEVL